MKTKKCTKCNEILSLDDFCNDKKSKDGKQSQCKRCKAKQLSSYYKNNKDKKVKRTKEQGRERYNKNKVNMNFSRRMRSALNGLKNGMSWEDIVGYTIIDLKTHLEKQFTEGMSWDNYGDWHIDHIKPISLFKIKKIGDEEFIKCWSLNNLQPLWKKDNLSKYNKYCPVD